MVDSTKLPEVDINAIATDLNNKADRDLVNLSDSGKNVIDSGWVKKYYQVIGSDTTLNARTTYEYDLSSYLPNDGNFYDVCYYAVGLSGTSQYNVAEIGIGGGVIEEADTYRAAYVKNVNGTAFPWCASGRCVIGLNRKFFIRQIANNNCIVWQLRFFGYKRIGTNT